MKSISSYVPNHLVPLLQPNPTGIHKLLAAWDDLSTSEQIILMTELSNSTISDSLEEKVVSKALDNNNAYVRYLAAQLARYKEGEIRKKIDSDPDPLVRYSVLENEYSLSYGSEPENCDQFYDLPQPARLAIVRHSTGGGENFSKLISHGMEHQVKDGAVTEEHIYEIICDYVCKPEFREYYTEDQIGHDPWGEVQDGKAIEEMWRLAAGLPDKISIPLIENLPISAGLSPRDDLPDIVKQSLSDWQLATLFYRKDVRLPDFRKSIFISQREDLKTARDAATCFCFDLQYSEFDDILKSPLKESARTLCNLAVLTHDLSLCIYDAISDALMSNNESMFAWEDAPYAERALEDKLKRLTGYQREKEIIELRLYHLAKQSVPWKEGEIGYPPERELKFLAQHVIADDAWGTFMAFSDAWKENKSAKKLEKYLPRIDGVTSEEDDDDVFYKDSASEPVALVETAGTERLLEEMSERIQQLYGAVESIGKWTSNVRGNLDRVQILAYIIIGLLVWRFIFK